MVGIIATLALALATLVQSSDMPTALLMTVILIEGTLGLIAMIGGMAKVYAVSVYLLESFKSAAVSKITSPWGKRYCKSCRPLKIMIGSGNYIDQKTPLTCIDAAISYCVDLLLIDSN